MSSITSERNAHTREIQNLEMKRRDQIDEMRKSYSKQLRSKDENHENHLQNIKETFKEEKAENAKAYTTKITSNNEEYSEIIRDLNTKNNRHIESLKEKFNEEKEMMMKGFDKELADLKKEYNAILKNKDQHLEQVKAQNSADRNYVSKRNANKIQDMKNDHHREIQELEAKSQMEITYLKRKLKLNSPA